MIQKRIVRFFEIFFAVNFAEIKRFQKLIGSFSESSKIILAGIYLPKVNNGNTGMMSKFFSNLIKKTAERR